MEPALKRRKVAQALTETEDDDELELEPDELNERRDPAFQLAEERAKAVNTLKSRFEHIFAKYGKDFTGVGDEIDLSTGKLVVDNGHLSSLKDTKGWIVDDDEEDGADGDEDDDEAGNEGEGPQEPGAPGSNATGAGPYKMGDTAHIDPWNIPQPSWDPESGVGGPSPPPSVWTHQGNSTHLNGSNLPSTYELSGSVDPTWSAPELPSSAFLHYTLGPSGGSKGRHYGGGTPVATKTVLRSSMPAPSSFEADEVDDLQVVSDEARSTSHQGTAGDGHLNEKSPLIRKKFPPLDSSPQDNSLVELIQDVVDNIPDTPPSIKMPRVAKYNGKPSPLGPRGLRKRSELGTKSKLRFSDTPDNRSSLDALRKRGRKPKSSPEPAVEDETPGSPDDLSPWDSIDLESYVDVTDLELEGLGQSLHIDIRASCVLDKVAQDVRGDTAIADDKAQKYLLAHHPKPADTGLITLKTPDQIAPIATDAEQPKKAAKSKRQEVFTRNVADPDFYFSDDETLLPKRRLNNKHLPDFSKPTPAPTPGFAAAKVDTTPLNDVTKRRLSAAEARRSVLDRESAARLPQQVTAATKTTETSSAESPMLVTPQPSDSGINYAIPDWIQESISAEEQALYTSEETRTQQRRRRRSKRLPSKPGLVIDASILPNHSISPSETPVTSDTETQHISKVNGKPTLESRSGQSRGRPGQRPVLRGSPSVERVPLRAGQDVDPRCEPLSIGQEAGQPAVESDVGRFNQATLSVTGSAVEHQHPQTEQVGSEDSTGHADDDRVDSPKIPSLWQTPPRRRPSTRSLGPSPPRLITAVAQSDLAKIATAVCQRCSELQKPCDSRYPCARCRRRGLGATECVREGLGPAARGRKRTALEASPDAEAEERSEAEGDEALRPSVPQRATEVEQPADVSSPTITKPSPPSTRPAPQPYTPRSSKPKRSKKTSTSSVKTSLISLLSDSDDSEDEISFHHSDFTPSGHHRILVNRRLSQLSTSVSKPLFSASSSSSSKSSQKKKRHTASLLYGRPHSATSSNRVSKNSRSEKRQSGAGTPSRRGERKHLPRSVVRVVRRRESHEERERAGSVVQTPGGTKRRCGVDGFKCDRDFCFVCM